MKKLIDRDDAIKAVHKTIHEFFDDESLFTDKDKQLLKINKKITQRITALPTADVGKVGKWIRNNDSDHAWKCSVCGCGYTDYRLSYCYDCGAEMKGEEK